MIGFKDRKATPDLRDPSGFYRREHLTALLLPAPPLVWIAA